VVTDVGLFLHRDENLLSQACKLMPLRLLACQCMVPVCTLCCMGYSANRYVPHKGEYCRRAKTKVLFSFQM
jgi:hypothetical protein